MTLDPSYPPPGDPSLGYQGSAPMLPPEQPGSIRALSITAICLGGLWTLCGALGTVMVFLTAFTQASGKPNPFAPAATPPPAALTAYNMVGAVIGLVLSIVELAFGIGGLSLKPWARQLGIAWSVVSILWAIANSMISLLWAGPLTLQSQPNNPMLSSEMGSKLIAGGAIISLVLCCVVPALILVFWTRPPVKNAFEQSAMVPGY